MKQLYQIAIILGITFIGELLNHIIPLPVPGSIYGLVILFSLLLSGIIKEAHIKELAEFLLQIMPLFFVPSAVGIMAIIADLKSLLVPLLIITVVSTLVVMIVTGRISQRIIVSKKRGGHHG